MHHSWDFSEVWVSSFLNVLILCSVREIRIICLKSLAEQALSQHVREHHAQVGSATPIAFFGTKIEFLEFSEVWESRLHCVLVLCSVWETRMIRSQRLPEQAMRQHTMRDHAKASAETPSAFACTTVGIFLRCGYPVS